MQLSVVPASSPLARSTPVPKAHSASRKLVAGKFRVAATKYSKGNATADDLYSLLGISDSDTASAPTASSSVAASAPVESLIPEPTPVDEPLQQAADTASSFALKASDALSSASQSLSAKVQIPIPELDDLEKNAADISNSLASAKSAALSGATDALNQAGQQITAVTDGLQGELGGLQAKAADAISLLEGSVSDAISQLTGEATSQTQQLSASLSGASASIEASASKLVGDALDALPAPVASALQLTASAVSGGISFLQEQPPAVAATIVAATVGVPSLLALSSIYSGFSGELTASAALKALQEENALLVDIRSVAEREASGIPELKSAARVKAVAVPIATLESSLGSRVSDPGRLALDITAAQIAGLAALNPGLTKVIIMDGNGSGSKLMARLVSSQGVSKTYLLKGGFQGFARQGLPVQPGVSKYEATQLQVVTDDVIAASEGLATKLREPAFAASTLLSAAAVGLAIANYHKTLEYIGVVGLQLTIIRKLASYNSPTEFFEDVGGTVDRLQVVYNQLAATAKRSSAVTRNTSTPPQSKEQ